MIVCNFVSILQRLMMSGKDVDLDIVKQLIILMK